MQENEQKNRVLNGTVVRLGLISFLTDLSSEMLYPITPIFLTTILGASMFSVGVIEGVAEGLASLLKTFSGAWSDKIQKRKTFVWLGYLLAAASKPLIGASTLWYHVFGARLMDRFGKGIRSAPRDALLAEAVVPELRGAAFGWHRAMDTLGAALGPLLALLLLSLSATQMKALYYWAVIPGLLSVLVAATLREPQMKPATISKPWHFEWADLNPRFKRYIFAWGVFSLANSSDVFLLLHAQKSGMSLTKTILMYAFYNLLYSLASPYLGGLSDRMDRKKVLIVGLLVFSFVYGLFGFATEEWQFWCLFGIYGLYMAATDGVGKALAVDLVPAEKKATGLGILGTVTGLATIVASSFAGLLWDQGGAQYTFLFGAIGALLAVLLLGFKFSTQALKD